MRPPNISCSHLYRGTFPWIPPTGIYRAYTVVYIFFQEMVTMENEKTVQLLNQGVFSLSADKKGELPLYMTEMFSTFSRAHNYNTRLSMTLDEPISLTPCGQLCIRYYLPKIVNKTNAALLSKVDTVSFESFTRCVKRSIISQYKEHCNNSGCFSCRREAQAAGHMVNPPAWWLAESLSSRTAGVLHRDATGTTWTDHVFAT